MTQRIRDRGWQRWWQLALPIAVASATLMATLGRQDRRVVPEVPQAVAQPVADLEPDAAVVAPAEDPAAAELTPDDVEADGQAHANGHPTRAEIGEWLRAEQWLSEGWRTGAIAGPRATGHPAPNQPTQALADQHRRVLATRESDPLPTAVFQNPDGPPRMDSGDPNPDRQRPPDAEAAQ